MWGVGVFFVGFVVGCLMDYAGEVRLDCSDRCMCVGGVYCRMGVEGVCLLVCGGSLGVEFYDGVLRVR